MENEALDAGKAPFLSGKPVGNDGKTGIGPHPRKDEPNLGEVSDAAITMFKRIYARAVEMGSPTTPGQMAILMRANDHDIGIEACRTLIKAEIANEKQDIIDSGDVSSIIKAGIEAGVKRFQDKEAHVVPTT